MRSLLDISLLHCKIIKSFARTAFHSYCDRMQAFQWGQNGVFISEKAVIRVENGSKLDIGAGSRIGPYTVISLRSDPRAASYVRPELSIGKNTAIFEFNNIRAGGGPVHIGDHCLISQFVSIIATNHLVDTDMLIREAPWDTSRKGVWIGNDVWIGTGACILPGVRIEDGSVIGAGSVVTSNIPARAIVTGAPAKLLRFRREAHQAGLTAIPP